MTDGKTHTEKMTLPLGNRMFLHSAALSIDGPQAFYTPVAQYTY